MLAHGKIEFLRAEDNVEWLLPFRIFPDDLKLGRAVIVETSVLIPIGILVCVGLSLLVGNMGFPQDGPLSGFVLAAAIVVFLLFRVSWAEAQRKNRTRLKIRICDGLLSTKEDVWYGQTRSVAASSIQSNTANQMTGCIRDVLPKL